MFTTKELPSFMRVKKLKKLYNENKMRFIYVDTQIVGFYTINNGMFQNLYIKKEFRKLGLATKSIKNEMAKGKITIATTRRNCPIKKLIKKLGFTFTGSIVQGKQSLLEIWVS